MQRYFFHFASREHRLPDNKGIELHSLGAAHEYAVRLIGKSGAYLVPEDIEGWRINIADITGRVHLIVLFPQVYAGHSACKISDVGKALKEPRLMGRLSTDNVGWQ